jgi:hypothetical protein
MEVLEHQQHGSGGCALGQKRERRLEHPQLRAPRCLVDLPRIAERSQGVDKRQKGELRPDEIDRAPDEDLEPRVAGPSRELGREPTLADTRISDDENGPTTSSPGRVESTLELSKLTDASNEDVAREGRHSSQCRAAHPRPGGRS